MKASLWRPGTTIKVRCPGAWPEAKLAETKGIPGSPGQVTRLRPALRSDTTLTLLLLGSFRLGFAPRIKEDGKRGNWLRQERDTKRDEG
jgi:hypothetical protein